MSVLAGMKGLMKAFSDGFSPQQVESIKKVLSSSTSTEVTEFKIQNIIEPPSPEKEKQEKDKLVLIKKGKASEVFPQPNDLPADAIPEFKNGLERINNFYTSPKLKDYEVIDMIINANPTEEQLKSLLDMFDDKKGSHELYELNRKLQCNNVIGQQLFGTYIPAISRDLIHFTEHYHEAPRDKVIETEDIPDQVKSKYSLIDLVRMAETKPREFNTALEQITDMKIERLASWYGWNVDIEKDLYEFNLFMNEFDLSPGERTLEWCLDTHPPEHTMEELPIIKLPDGEKIEDNL